MHPLLEGKNVKKTYGRQVVLNDLSFLVSEGQKIALIGRNGAGKSTLLNIMTGSEEADSGGISPFAWTKLGIIRQHTKLPSDVTTEEYLMAASGRPPLGARKT